MRRPASLMLAAAIATAAPAQERMPAPAPIPVAEDGPLAAVTTHHAVTLPAGRIAYRATWFETVLKDDAGVPHATISATAYVRDGIGDAARRPVMFLFNGGPGASSSPLHMRAFGPRILPPRDAAAGPGLVDNPATLLDIADLVFIDPVGTGFSRPLRPGGGAPWWSVAGDARAALTLIRGWLADNHRSASPVYIAGESYGGYRLGTMARDMADLNVAGLILISPALDFGGGRDQSAIDALPTLAVAAWHHRSRGDGRTVEAVWEDARRFAQGDYAAALQLGSAIDPVRREATAARLATLTGMTPNTDLRIDSQRFLESLVPGLVVGRLDVRVAAPKREGPVGRPAAANDPSLGLGRTNVIVSAPIGAYLREALRVPTRRDYFSLTLDVNFSWNWTRPSPRPGEGWSVADGFATLMAKRPAARLLVLSAYYDLATPALATRYALDHSMIPRDRVQSHILPVGHSVAEGDQGRGRSAAIVRAFVAGAPVVRERAVDKLAR